MNIERELKKGQQEACQIEQISKDLPPWRFGTDRNIC